MLGAWNFRALRGQSEEAFSFMKVVRRFSEMEIGIGITAILAAASLTLQPPGVDLVNDRVSLPVIVERMTPHAPLLRTPPLETLSALHARALEEESPDDRIGWPGGVYAGPRALEAADTGRHCVVGVQPSLGRPHCAGDWHFAGTGALWPCAMGSPLADRVSWFSFLSADSGRSGNWPLGPSGFWESFTSSDVMQHRIFVLLIVLFAAFEWRVQMGRAAGKSALVFPAICALGGAVLLTHTHALTNVREQLLAEVSHLPLALLAVAAGWSRWLELRGAGRSREIAARVWPVCFALIGVVLLNYREA